MLFEYTDSELSFERALQHGHRGRWVNVLDLAAMLGRDPAEVYVLTAYFTERGTRTLIRADDLWNMILAGAGLNLGLLERHVAEMRHRWQKAKRETEKAARAHEEALTEYRRRQGIRKSRGISVNQRDRILQRDGHCCRYCQIALTEQNRQIDHLIPVIRGGDHSDDNLVACCAVCNRRKRSMTPDEAGMLLHPAPTTAVRKTDSQIA